MGNEPQVYRLQSGRSYHYAIASVILEVQHRCFENTSVSDFNDTPMAITCTVDRQDLLKAGSRF